MQPHPLGIMRSRCSGAGGSLVAGDTAQLIPMLPAVVQPDRRHERWRPLLWCCSPLLRANERAPFRFKSTRTGAPSRHRSCSSRQSMSPSFVQPRTRFHALTPAVRRVACGCPLTSVVRRQSASDPSAPRFAAGGVAGNSSRPITCVPTLCSCHACARWPRQVSSYFL